MFTNYPLAVQILGWGVFMGLNGYVGATCPGLNLAVLALISGSENRKMGIILLVVAIIVTLVENAWYFLNMFAAGMSSAGNARVPSFLQQGSGVINLILAGIVFFVLLRMFSGAIVSTKWVTLVTMILFYTAGVYAGIRYWTLGVSSLLAVGGAGVILVLHYTSSYLPLVMGTLIFLALVTTWGVELVQWSSKQLYDKRADKLTSVFLQAAADNQPEKMKELWDQVNPGTKKVALAQALEKQNTEVIRFLAPSSDASFDILFSAIEYPNLEKIKTLVQAGAPVDSLHLSRALEKGHMEIAEHLLKTGKFSQNVLNEELWSVTSHYYDDEAVREKVVKLLLAHGAEANGREATFGLTPLHGASGHGPLEIVKLLVSKGADVNATDHHGATALMKAAEADQMEIAQFLLEHGADKTINSVHNDPNSFPTQRTALFEANSAAMARLLLDHGAQTSHKDSHGNSVLLNAVHKRNIELVKVFLDKGVDVNAQDREGTTALLEAAQNWVFSNEQIEVVKLLLAKGVDVNLADQAGNTPLLVSERLEVLQMLLDHGADVNAKNKAGQTPLIKIAQDVNDDEGTKIKLLLDHGADVNAKDDKGNTALVYASKRGEFSKKRIEVLKQYGAKK